MNNLVIIIYDNKVKNIYAFKIIFNKKNKITLLKI